MTDTHRRGVREQIVNDDLEKVLRYETAIERSLYRALHELQRVQAIRLGYKPSIPIAIDVDFPKE